jgi:hypothetical protein
MLAFDNLCFDCEIDYGLPFTLYQAGTLMRPTKIVWIGLLANVFTAALTGLALGIGLSTIWDRFRGSGKPTTK